MDIKEPPRTKEADNSESPTIITLCQYKNGKLVSTEEKWGEREYIAVSHVWGNAQWRRISIADGELMVSSEKAKFLEHQLPSIVGRSWFWMDILCINQRDSNARVSVTQHIPTIFRSATKTLVVRESAGIRHCCAMVVPDISKLLFSTLGTNYNPRSIPDHYRDQTSHQPKGEDGILTRLWPFQEIILSDNLQFVRCDGTGESDSEPSTAAATAITLRVVKNMFNLAFNWTHYHIVNYAGLNGNDIMPFVRAFVENGTVSRGQRWNGGKDSIKSVISFRHTPRYTTKPRDF